MQDKSKESNVLDNGLPRCNMPWRSESGRSRNKATQVVILRNPCKIGTWNVCTMLPPGKLEEMKGEMMRLGLDILGLCEIRWEGSGDYWSDEYRIIYTGEKQGSNGTAIVLNKKWGNLVENTIHHSDRITAIKIKSKPVDTFIIQVYMPTGNHSDEEIEQIYEQLDTLIDLVKEKDNLVIMGDFNAVVGEGIEGNMVGKYGLGKRNRRGDRLVQFCSENDLSISNTIFDQPKRRRYTWKMPGDIGRYQLDYIMVKQKYKNMVSKCKTYPGADLNTDHNLLACKIDIRIKKLNRKHKSKDIDLNKLKVKNSVKVKYSNMINDKLKKYNESNNIDISIDNKWCNIRDIIKTSAEDTLQKEKIKPRKKWLNTEISNLILERRKYRNKSDDASLEKYRKITNKITLKCREQKEKDIEQDCDSIDHYMKIGKIDVAYNIIRNLNENKKNEINGYSR